MDNPIEALKRLRAELKSNVKEELVSNKKAIKIIKKYDDAIALLEKENVGYLVPIAVIDANSLELCIYNVYSHYDTKMIEEIISYNHKLSEVSWGMFKTLVDHTEENYGKSLKWN